MSRANELAVAVIASLLVGAGFGKTTVFAVVGGAVLVLVIQNQTTILAGIQALCRTLFAERKTDEGERRAPMAVKLREFRGGK